MAKIDLAERIVVCDAGPLIHLDELTCLDLLTDFADVFVPMAVWDEVSLHRPSALTCPGLVLHRADVTDTLPIDLTAVSRLFGLHVGELQALHVALRVNADVLLTDDTAARLAARQLGLSGHGTLGILLRSIRRRQRTAQQALAILRSLPHTSTLHISKLLLEEVIGSVETSAKSH